MLSSLSGALERLIGDDDAPSPKDIYTGSVFNLLRSRLSSIRVAGRREDVVIFLGRESERVDDLNRQWAAMSDRGDLPSPADILSWL